MVNELRLHVLFIMLLSNLLLVTVTLLGLTFLRAAVIGTSLG